MTKRRDCRKAVLFLCPEMITQVSPGAAQNLPEQVPPAYNVFPILGKSVSGLDGDYAPHALIWLTQLQDFSNLSVFGNGIDLIHSVQITPYMAMLPVCHIVPHEGISIVLKLCKKKK